MRTRRKFVAGAAAVVASAQAGGQAAGGIRGYDHVALPMQNTGAMLVFYRALGLEVRESANAVSVYIGEQMINFHRPAWWQNPSFTLRAGDAKPPCGDW